ncbi:phage baseplate assembly protein V [Frankia sp. ACN1ag]|uniref:phage baseplate assembly protein V n=1 Tax=Frankia sp. ACN1ag TaxID=102891 RepID=UPI0006DC2ED7|nr:phage baseplate assembly protein V [Frankia sp. ACN1ag]KQC39048.1 baseplate assembly protein [Frankia sp. ACN1ag]
MNHGGATGGADAPGARRYYGKYRGTVVINVDPEQRGRIMALVPDVLGLTPSSWAMPCVPFAGKGSGAYLVPEVGSGVWIEFEQGDPDFPIWVGGFWGAALEVPPTALAPPPIPPGQNVVISTTGRASITLSDSAPTPATGGIVLRSVGGSMIVVNDSGIYLRSAGGATITMIGPTVDVNNTALTVT